VPARFLRKTIAQLLAVSILASAAAAGLALWRQQEAHPFSDDASIDADVVHVAPSVSGRIVRLPVKENQAVRAGDVLFEIDPEPYRLRVRLAEAQLTQAEAILDTQRRTVSTETSNATIANDQIRQATASLQLATNTVARLEPLLGKGYVSQQQVDDARTAKRKAETELTQAQVQAASTKTAIGNTDSASADVEARRSALALAQRDLRLTVVTADHDGRVTGLVVETGEYVTVAEALFTLVVTDEWFASANFRETELGHIAVGTCADVYSLIDRTVPIRGRVDGIGWGVRDQDRVDLPRGVPYVAKSVNWVRVEQRFPVRVRLEAPPEALMRLGASATVQIRPAGDCAS
jgi:membrane fusion protein, multidrug efflux system